MSNGSRGFIRGVCSEPPMLSSKDAVATADSFENASALEVLSSLAVLDSDVISGDAWHKFCGSLAQSWRHKMRQAEVKRLKPSSEFAAAAHQAYIHFVSASSVRDLHGAFEFVNSKLRSNNNTVGLPRDMPLHLLLEMQMRESVDTRMPSTPTPEELEHLVELQHQFEDILYSLLHSKGEHTPEMNQELAQLKPAQLAHTIAYFTQMIGQAASKFVGISAAEGFKALLKIIGSQPAFTQSVSAKEASELLQLAPTTSRKRKAAQITKLLDDAKESSNVESLNAEPLKKKHKAK